ncbi:DNA-methyltransferase [Photobacterium leiognathi]|uniref:DNA-methyltransferase n=1 Tax=Photobacterium leiognathi TaxID=553611 RepID=UPI00298160D2|nr:site-specific DNA-methyltransferase [Photobacterium leiognathi]
MKSFDTKCLVHGDCFDVIEGVPSESVDLIITSPPYADRRKLQYDSVSANEYVQWFIPLAKEIKRVLKPTGSFILNIKPHCEKGERSLYVFKLVLALVEVVGFRFTDEFCWTKVGMPGKFKGRFKNAFEPCYHFTVSSNYTFNPYDVATPAKETSIKRYSRGGGNVTNNGSGFAGLRGGENKSKLALPSNHLHFPNTLNQFSTNIKHPAVFPIGLCDFFVKAFSNKNDVVLDPFMGSGRVGVSAIRNGRKFIGIEKKKTFFDLSVSDIELVSINR